MDLGSSLLLIASKRSRRYPYPSYGAWDIMGRVAFSFAEEGRSMTGISIEGEMVPGVYDEMISVEGQTREHWKPLVKALGILGMDALRARGETARKFLLEHGVTYNVYGNAQGFERSWQLDPLPLLIPPEEWGVLEAGLTQRARLLGMLLEDLYGPQRLLREGLLPAAFAYANPGFLRPCRGVGFPGGVPLFLHAVDLARSPEGRWRVLADRTQAPSGAGYALVNRVALARVFPEEFKDCRVQRLAAFFQVMRDTLRGLSPQDRGNPNVVLLTPGAYNEAYFEHAYLARYLGFPLVEGGDLTVRDRKVFIKTLEGLRRVDVILRRVDDHFCDPLELRPDSFLGVAGLLEAVRAGTVAVANPLGSGVVESPALLAFLPGLCRHLLGEDLLLPSAGTWWCGQPREMSHVTSRLRELVVKRAFPHGSGQPWFGDALDDGRVEAMVKEIRSTPHAFVGQEKLTLSRAPVLQRDKFVSRCLVLRAFVCAGPSGFHVMPGGLTRVTLSPSGTVVSTQSGGSSKDTWVMTHGPVAPVTLFKPAEAVVRIERQASEVPSRVADSLFWLGRYAERLEDNIRLLRVAVTKLSGESIAEPPPELATLIALMVKLGMLSAAALDARPAAKLEKHLLLMIYQGSRLGSVREVLNRLRHLAFAVRDRFTGDTWRIFNKLQMDAQARPGHLPVTESLALLNTLIQDLAAFNGMAMENMTRGHGWLFLDFGRRLERSLHMTALVKAALWTDPAGSLLLDPLLEIADSVMTYRRRYYARPQWPGVADLLLHDDSNPRSVAFQMQALAEHLAKAPVPQAAGGLSRERRLLEDALFRLREVEMTPPDAYQSAAAPAAMVSMLERLSLDLEELSEAVTLHYLSHADVRPS